MYNHDILKIAQSDVCSSDFLYEYFISDMYFLERIATYLVIEIKKNFFNGLWNYLFFFFRICTTVLVLIPDFISENI